MKIKKEYEVTVCDVCGKEAALSCAICGKDICQEHGRISRRLVDEFGWQFLITSYDSSFGGYAMCSAHLEDIKSYVNDLDIIKRRGE